MNLFAIPHAHLRAIFNGSPGLKQVADTSLKFGYEPDLRVNRHVCGAAIRWTIELLTPLGTWGPYDVDMSRLDTAVAIVPIFLVEVTGDLRRELPEVFIIDGFYEGVELVLKALGVSRLARKPN
jgi:hypothetical protein